MLFIRNALFIGFGMILWVQPLHAAPFCDEVIEEDFTPILPPISPYTERVLKRIQDAHLFAINSERATEMDISSWAKSIGTSFGELIDTKQRIIEQRTYLETHTACLRIDVLLLECAMERVREEYSNAFKNYSISGMMRYRELLSFIDERIESLIRGSRDPIFEDGNWDKVRMFDPPYDSWCCTYKENIECEQSFDRKCRYYSGVPYRSLDACIKNSKCIAPEDDPDEESEEPMCPFSSDYLPPNISGFGCDEMLLEELPSQFTDPETYPALAEEFIVLKSISEDIETFRDGAEHAFDLIKEIEIFQGKREEESENDTEESTLEREHVTFNGCLEIRRYCEDDPERSCTDDSDCGSVDGECVESGFKATCSEDEEIECSTDNDCIEQNAGKCMNLSKATRWSLRGPFSIEKNHVKILDFFQDLRGWQGKNRKHAEKFTYPSEFSEAPRVSKAVLPNLFRANGRGIFEKWNEKRGGLEAPLVAVSDSIHVMSENLQSLRDSMGRLSQLSHEREGLRRLVINFGFFLRRSCIHRPCNIILEKAMKIAFTNQCFPYTNGEYTNDSCEDPRVKKCIKAAELNKLIDSEILDGDTIVNKEGDGQPDEGFPEDMDWNCDD